MAKAPMKKMKKSTDSVFSIRVGGYKAYSGVTNYTDGTKRQFVLTSKAGEYDREKKEYEEDTELIFYNNKKMLENAFTSEMAKYKVEKSEARLELLGAIKSVLTDMDTNAQNYTLFFEHNKQDEQLLNDIKALAEEEA